MPQTYQCPKCQQRITLYVQPLSAPTCSASPHKGTSEEMVPIMRKVRAS